MFGFHLAKFSPTSHVFLFQNGRVRRSGTGLAFVYFAPNSTVVAVPVAATQAYFIYKLQTLDAQEVDVQGQILYRIADPARAIQIADFTVRPDGRYESEDPEKLPERIVNLAQVIAGEAVRRLTLADAIRAHAAVVGVVEAGLAASESIQELGVKILHVNIQAITPPPAIAAAMGAETREELLGRADKAGFARRRAAVDQERAIKEAELETKRTIVQRENELQKITLQSQIALEEDRRSLAQAQADNERTQAKARADGVGEILRAYGSVDARLVEAITLSTLGPEQMLAQAIRNLAASPGKIGELNLTSELLGAVRERA